MIKCVIPHKHHRDVMGAKGSNVQGVTQEHNVTIRFPERDPGATSDKKKVHIPTRSRSYMLFII